MPTTVAQNQQFQWIKIVRLTSRFERIISSFACKEAISTSG